MHIVHLTPYYAPAYPFGGVARAVEGMAQALVARGHRVSVLTTDAHSQATRHRGAPRATEAGVQVVRVRNRSVWLRGRANLSTPVGMRAAAAQLLPTADVLHCHEFRTTENLLVTPLAAQQGVPMLLSPHGTLTHATGRGLLKRGWDAALSPSVARRFSLVLGLTDHERDEARQHWQRYSHPSAAFGVVPNGVDAAAFVGLDGAAFRQRWGLGAARVVLYLGRLHPRKGADKLARAFITADVPGAHLVIAGPDEGLRPVLEALAARHPHITLTGYLDGDERLGALGAADLFALPAVGEGLPMSALEALAAGVPALLSEECHLPQVAQAGAGRVVLPDEAHLAPALRDLLTMDPAPMGRAARQLVAGHFTWAAVAAQLENHYQAVAL